VTTPPRFFAEWKSAYPRSEGDVERLVKRPPTPQDTLLAGLLAPEILLDVFRNFTVFERDDKTGKTIRKIPRYQQYGAVSKAIARAGNAKRPTERGGIVWHTQGSGKSLTMLWLAIKLRRDEAHENPTLVLVTDRVDLDEQIAKTFQACGFPNPQRAESVRELRDLLRGPGGGTILTTVHKFQDLAIKGKKRSEFPTLTEARNVFVLTDEAHRTQYGSLAANMRKALPNAAFFGFTGTPIDKKDRSTLQTFGPYIDTYTIEQSVKDGATVPIFYESRLPELRIMGNSLDAIFDRVFADRSKEEREAIKKKYATESAIAEAPKRIEAICLDLVEHFTPTSSPTATRRRWWRAAGMRRFSTRRRWTGSTRPSRPSSSRAPTTTRPTWSNTTPTRTSANGSSSRFLKTTDPLSILIVCDMLITGFDAPIEQVMYLDSPLKEHTLLQAIARVNRVYDDNKKYGLIVDYWGVSEALQEALAIFSPGDVKGAMTPKSDELPRLQTRHQAAMRFFLRVKDRDDLNGCVNVLLARGHARRVHRGVSPVRPEPGHDPSRPEGAAYTAGLPLAGQDSQGGLGQVPGSKPRHLGLRPEGAEAHRGRHRGRGHPNLGAEGEPVHARVRREAEGAQERRGEGLGDGARHQERDPRQARRGSGVLPVTSATLGRDHRSAQGPANRCRQAARTPASLVKDLKGPTEQAGKLGLSSTGFALYGLLHEGKPSLAADAPAASYGGTPNPAKVALATLLEEAVAPHVGIVDWVSREDVQKDMRRLVKRQLRAAHTPEDKLDALAEQVVDLLKRRQGRS
jgi:type I restriction enzyme R subunit